MKSSVTPLRRSSRILNICRCPTIFSSSRAIRIILFARSDVQRSILARSYGGKPHLMASGDMRAYMETSASLSSGRYVASLTALPFFSVTGASEIGTLDNSSQGFGASWRLSALDKRLEVSWRALRPALAVLRFPIWKSPSRPGQGTQLV